VTKKGNKEVLQSVNYNINIIKDIKAGKKLTQDDKENILNKYSGMSDDNNSFWTPVPIVMMKL